MNFLPIVNNLNLLENLEEIKFVGFDPDTSGSILVGKNYDKDIILIVKSLQITNLNQLDKNKLKLEFVNDRFEKYTTSSNVPVEIIKIHPAKKEDFVKYCSHKKKLIETYDLYSTIVFPRIINQNLDWIDNIVFNKKEAASILYQDEDFVFLPDLKWDKKNIESLYFLAIVKNKNLRSIRDLKRCHLNLLKKINNIGINLLCEKYNKNDDEFRLYFHYPPSFWQLHIHFNLISKKWSGALIDYSHSLNNVINNIQLLDNYYQLAELEIITVEVDVEECNV